MISVQRVIGKNPVLIQSTEGVCTDPKLKRWETGLVCDRCKRKAVALTLFKAGDIWDSNEWTQKFVDKRLCYSCTKGMLTVISHGYRPGSKWRKLFVWVIAVLFFGSGIGGLVTSSLSVQPSIPLVLWGIFFSMILVYFGGMLVGREAKRTRRARSASPPPPPLVSVEEFFSPLDA